MKASSLSEEEKKAAVKDFNFPKGLAIALLAGLMSGCFNVGLEFGKGINFGELTEPMFRTLPATFLVTLGGFITNAIYCFYQNQKNKTWSDYKKTAIWGNNLLFCLLAGVLWYSDSHWAVRSSRQAVRWIRCHSASSWHSTSSSLTFGASSSRSGRAAPRRPSPYSS